MHRSYSSCVLSFQAFFFFNQNSAENCGGPFPDLWCSLSRQPFPLQECVLKILATLTPQNSSFGSSAQAPPELSFWVLWFGSSQGRMRRQPQDSLCFSVPRHLGPVLLNGQSLKTLVSYFLYLFLVVSDKRVSPICIIPTCLEAEVFYNIS